MNVEELNRNQLVELKQAYLCEMYDHVYWEQLARADELVSDEEVIAAYCGITFTNDDFVCTGGSEG
jgi:hypothetical protein